METERPISAPLSGLHTLVLVDDHELLREGLVARLAKTGRWRVIAQASSLVEAARVFDCLSAEGNPPPDLVLLDMDLKGEWGLYLAENLKSRYGDRRPPVLIYSVYDDYVHLKAAFRAGGCGFRVQVPER